jgi:hypothetical protein
MEDIIDIIVTETTNTIEITAQPNDEIIDVNIIDNREDVTLNVTPTVVEININSLTGNFGILWGEIEGTLSNQTDLNNALALKANLVGGKVPASELPSYVDDVVEVATFSALPATGEIGKIYVILDTNKIYRWSGSVYVEIADSTAVWGAITGTLSNQTDLQTALNAKQDDLNGTGFVKASGTTISYDNSTYALDSAVVKLAGVQTITGLKTFSGGLIANVSTGGDQGFYSINTSTSASSVFVQNNSTGIGILANNALGGDAILIGNDTSGRGIYITNATISGSGKGISIDNYNSGIGIEVGSDSSADAIKVLHLAGRAFNIQSSGGGYGVIINNTTASTSAPFTIQKQGASVITLTDAGAGTFNSSLTANSFVKTSGTSSQFLKADGSVDSSVYALDSAVVKLTGAQTIAGVKTMSNVFKLDDTLQIKNIAQLSNNTGYTGVWAETAAIGFYTGANAIRLLYAGNYNYTMPSADGTLALTSQLSSYLPLSGGTLTGALSGTSADFTGQIASTFLNINSTSGQLGSLRSTNANGGYITWESSANTIADLGTLQQIFGSGGSDTFGINARGTRSLHFGTNNTSRFIISSTGAATFSSSVTANGIIYGTNGITDPGVGTNAGTTLAYNGFSATNNFSTGLAGVRNGVYDMFFQTGATNGGGYRWYIGTSEKMTMSSSGNVGIGTTSPAQKITIVGSYVRYHALSEDNTNAGAYFQVKNGSTTVGQSSQFVDNAGNWIIYTGTSSEAERMRIRSDGNIVMPQVYNNTSGVSANLFIAADGELVRATSSIKYKKDVINYDKGLDLVQQMRPVYYKGISKMDGDKQFAGFIAEEINELGLSEFVQFNNDNEVEGLGYGNITALLVNAIKELKAELDTLKNK